MRIYDIARVAHEANRAYCQSLDDHSHAEWLETSSSLQESAMNGVKAILENPGLTPKQSHERWLKLKTEQGWVHGELKDGVLKTHPCCVPYDQLPQDQQVKDQLFGAVVRALAAVVDAPGE